MSELLIVLPLPPACLGPNSRDHWRVRNAATKIQREAGYLAALDAVNRAPAEVRAAIPWREVTFEATFWFRQRRRRDQANLEARLKAAQDGVIDAGIVADDSWDHVRNLPSTFRVDGKRPRVDLLVRKVE